MKITADSVVTAMGNKFLSFPESLSESDLANEYETVIIEERNIQQWRIDEDFLRETTAEISNQ